MFSFLEALINKTLLLDPKATTQLKKLDGKHVKVEIRHLHSKFSLELSFYTTGLHISMPKQAVFDAIVFGSPFAFLYLILTKDPHKASQMGLNMEGNIEVAQTVQALFMELDIDWEEALAKFTNDSFAHTLGQFVRSFKKRNQELFASFTNSVTDYLQEEKKILPSPNEVEAFYQEIESIRDQVERIDARLERLERVETQPTRQPASPPSQSHKRKEQKYPKKDPPR